MSKTSKIILVTIIATLILLGLGYAAITNITLNIAGSASASADQANFKVRFVGTPVVSDSTAATATITADHTATINVSGLTTAGQYVTATYEIENESQDLSADLNVETTNNNVEYFTISSQLAKSSLTAGETTTALVTVKLTKTPIDGDVSANISVGLTAMPVEPGKEGTSVGTNDYSSTPIDKPLNEYGFYYGEGYTYVYPGGMVKGLSTTVVFKEDGTVELYSEDDLCRYFPAEQVVYSENMITIEEASLEYTVSDNGYSLITDGDTYELNDTFMDRQEIYVGETNQYGFYYDIPYVCGLFGTTRAMVLNEDSTISWFDNGIYTEKEKVSYSTNKIERISLNYESFINVYESGRIMLSESLAFCARALHELYDYVYITKNESTGEYVYLDAFPDVHKVNDMYAVGDYLYTYTADGWKVEILTDSSILPDGFEISNREQESYQQIFYEMNKIAVTDLSNVFAGCTKLVVAPEISSYAENMSGMFDGCTSLTTAPDIHSDVTNVTNAFRGCTSLTGEIEIYSNDITEYTGCFAGVDMSKITLTGSASNEIKNKLGSTGLNYVMLPEEVEE